MTVNQTSTAGTDALTQDTNVTSEANRLANTDMFMKLLVAQLQYQNPMNPADGVEFMTQLTQFSQLEQMIGAHQELTRIREALLPELEADQPQPAA